MIFTISTILLFIALLLVSGNNLAACVGTLTGSGMLGRRPASIYGALGFMTGLLAQGYLMRRIDSLLLPGATPFMIETLLSVTILIFFIAYLFRVPIPLTMALTGAALGVAFGSHLHYDVAYFNNIILMWIISPPLAIGSSFMAVRFIERSKPRNVWRRASMYKALLFSVSFLSSYVLGANTMGVVVAVAGYNYTNIAVAVVAIFAGSLLLSSRTLRRISQEMYAMRYSSAFSSLSISIVLVEAATLFGIPLSNTQAIASSVFGAGITHKLRYLSLRPFLAIVLGWLMAALLSFAVAFIVR